MMTMRPNKRESVFSDKALQNYLIEISKYKPLSREEEHELALRAQQGDQNAINKLIQANLKFVVKIASRFQNRGLSLSELISEGNIGLIKAIEKFEPDKDVKLISYAIWWIKQRIMLAVSEKSSLIRVPLGKASSVNRLKATAERMFSETGEMPSVEELGDRMNITDKAIDNLRGNIFETTSLDDIQQTNDFFDFATGDLLEDKSLDDPQTQFFNELLQAKINAAIEKLDARESMIIRSYFGLNKTQESKNFAQIAEEMGISRERVRQIQKEALRKIMLELKPGENSEIDEFLARHSYF